MQLANFTTHDPRTHIAQIRKVPLIYETPRTGIPKFPNFKPLELSDREEIEDFVKQFPPYSDFNFVSLWSYDVKNEASCAFLNENLVIRYNDYITSEPFYSILGTNRVEESFNDILNRSAVENISSFLKLVPEKTIGQLLEADHNFDIKADLDNHDYVFSIDDISQLKGGKYKDQRNLINRFKKNSDVFYRHLDLSDLNIQNQMLTLFNTWRSVRQKEPNDVEHELSALKRLIQTGSMFRLISIGVYCQNFLVGFSISELVHDEYAISHFIKADTSVKGSAQYLKYETVKVLKLFGIKYYNLEQDLGILGLRDAKKFWYPSHYLKKFRVSFKKKVIGQKRVLTSSNKII